MKAENRTIQDWLGDVERGIVRLPRFQRQEAWGHVHVEQFLRAVIFSDHPTGVLLVLDVNPHNQPFQTRALEGTSNNGEKCSQHLLDGQQRLTALWKATNDKYSAKGYFLKLDEGEKWKFADVEGLSKSRNSKWIDKAAEQYKRGYVPLKLLCPTSGLMEALDWLQEVKLDEASRRSLLDAIQKLRDVLVKKNLAFFRLPPETDPEDAIDIFIQSNTSFVKLSAYDIAVAMFEAETQESLQELVEDIKDRVPAIVSLEGEDGVGDLVLKIACLREGRMPTYGNYRELDMKALHQSRKEIFKGIEWAVTVMGGVNLWLEKHLPSKVPLRVLSALHRDMPTKGTDKGKADELVSRYVWRSFVTNRYDRQANDRLLKDYRALKEALETRTYIRPPSTGKKDDTVFDCPLPKGGDLEGEGWPTGVGILKRAILAVCNMHGAKDLATGEEISVDNVMENRRNGEGREHHHIFPKSLMGKGKRRLDCDHALNCMLIEGFTNRQFRDKWPGEYMLEKEKEIGGSGAKGKLRERLESHLVPADMVLGAVERNGSLSKQYKAFIKERGKMVAKEMHRLCGED